MFHQISIQVPENGEVFLGFVVVIVEYYIVKTTYQGKLVLL